MSYRTTRTVGCDGIGYADRAVFPRSDVEVDPDVIAELLALGAIEEDEFAPPPPAPPPPQAADGVSDTAPVNGMGEGAPVDQGDAVSDTAPVNGLGAEAPSDTPPPPPAEAKPLAQMTKAELLAVAAVEEVHVDGEANKPAIIGAIIAARKAKGHA